MTNNYDDYEWSEESEDAELFERLFNLMEECYTSMNNMPKERPIFSEKQVLSVEDMEVGKRYKHWHKTECCEQILLTLPYKHDEESASWFFMVHSVAYDFNYEQSMADCSIIPYPSGGWNDTNYMEVCEDQA